MNRYDLFFPKDLGLMTALSQLYKEHYYKEHTKFWDT